MEELERLKHVDGIRRRSVDIKKTRKGSEAHNRREKSETLELEGTQLTRMDIKKTRKERQKGLKPTIGERRAKPFIAARVATMDRFYAILTGLVSNNSAFMGF